MFDLKSVKESKNWSHFTEKDTFNKNEIQGYICHQQGQDYGSLLIEKVNGEEVLQAIHATPKLQYPFDKHQRYQWPKAKIINRYEKLDGTNVLAYSYTDSKSNLFVSYKTRLKPFLTASRFGDFLSLWKEMLQKYPDIKKLKKLGTTYSFELYGNRNPHLIKYAVPLETKLLFSRIGGQVLPSSLTDLGSLVIPTAAFKGSIDRDYVYNYENAQKEIDLALVRTKDGEQFEGEEGEVWYLQNVDETWTMFKMKPETIEIIHWSQGSLNLNVIRATIENAYESMDEPTLEHVNQLLSEEFDERVVSQFSEKTGQLLDVSLTRKKLKVEIIEYYKSLGVSILADKAAVMRAVGAMFGSKRVPHLDGGKKSLSTISFLYNTIQDYVSNVSTV